MTKPNRQRFISSFSKLDDRTKQHLRRALRKHGKSEHEIDETVRKIERELPKDAIKVYKELYES